PRRDPSTARAAAVTPPALGVGGGQRAVSGRSYRPSRAGRPPSTRYGIEATTGALFQMGSVGGSPISADSGQMFAITTVSGTPGAGANGFAISPATGIAYENTFGSLYRVDLVTWTATSL